MYIVQNRAMSDIEDDKTNLGSHFGFANRDLYFNMAAIMPRTGHKVRLSRRLTQTAGKYFIDDTVAVLYAQKKKKENKKSTGTLSWSVESFSCEPLIGRKWGKRSMHYRFISKS